MTILIGFHGSRYRTFKDFYQLQVNPYWSKAMPKLVSYNRFVELMSYALLALFRTDYSAEKKHEE